MHKALPARSTATNFNFIFFPFPPPLHEARWSPPSGRAPDHRQVAPVLLQACKIERLERSGKLLRARPYSVRRSDQAGAPEITVRAERALLREFRGVGTHRRDGACVRVLDVDVERPRAGIFEACDRIVGRNHAIDGDTAQAVPILLEIGVAEDADGAGIGLDLLDDQIVVLTGFDIGAVLPKARADRLELVLIGL